MTMTLAFDEQRIQLTEEETRTVLRLIREIRDGLYADDDVHAVRGRLHDTVERFIHRHTGEPLDAIHVDINADASHIAAHRARGADA